MEALPNLQVLILKSNKFDGNMSLASRSNLPFQKLQVLDISDNEFVGSLPQTYFKNFRAMMDVKENKTDLITSIDYFLRYVEMRITLKGLDQLLKRLLEDFTIIDLSSNKFSGTIPRFIGNLNSLRYLNLSHNNLMGHIPASLGNISVLESLDLSSNKLDGRIPSELTRLCGVPLTRKCNEENGQQMRPKEEDDKDDEYGFIDGFGWRSVVMGYGSGIIVGIGIGCWIIRFGRPRWLVEFFFGVGYTYKKKKKKKKKTRKRATPTQRRS
ncbi:receptor like protein 22-like [Salvia miltiorrhiza]|uniref:receptor like protein 22-like n=1 Tax=Salvia miltiorrhiza TaxID=226208 RepID=UPI0025ABD813|nr:receptor like protein 22-like [Salvia miltiorrhiza]